MTWRGMANRPRVNVKPDLQLRAKSTGCSAFTVRELLVVIVTLALLAATVLPALFRSSDRALRARCVSNLRQLGVALQTYANEANEILPICKYRDFTPWYTYEVARAESGNMQITQGYMNLGLLTRTRHISEPQLLYCPAQRSSAFTYEYYVSASNGWFLSPQGDSMVRAGYNYFPQLQATQQVSANLFLPRVTMSTVILEFGSLGNTALQPMRFHELDLRKSIVTDLVHNAGIIAHRDRGMVGGINALFPDGRVTFQNARANPDNFSPTLWGNISSDGLAFRQVMNGWKP